MTSKWRNECWPNILPPNYLFLLLRKIKRVLPMPQEPQPSNGRDNSLDFVKGVLIILMIAFHLVYIGDAYPYAKKVVYAFHMPGFLILSGYLMNISKPFRDFQKTILRFFIPYLMIESGYILMASLLPIREHIDMLTPAIFLEKLLLHPLGPYWYLHTLILCGCAYYATHCIKSLQKGTRMFLFAAALAALTLANGILAFPYALYFFIGTAIRQGGTKFNQFFRASWIAIPAFFLLALNEKNLSTDCVKSLLLIYCALSALLFLHQSVPGKIRIATVFLGKRTLPLYLYSPIFTFICKPLSNLLSFDPTGMLFLIVSLALCIGGALTADAGIKWGTEKAKKLFAGHA